MKATYILFWSAGFVGMPLTLTVRDVPPYTVRFQDQSLAAVEMPYAAAALTPEPSSAHHPVSLVPAPTEDRRRVSSVLSAETCGPSHTTPAPSAAAYSRAAALCARGSRPTITRCGAAAQ